MTVTAADIKRATVETSRALAGLAREAWDAPAGDLDWSCWDTGGHIADDLFSYASQVIAQPNHGYLPIEATIEAGATPDGLLSSIEMCGELLSLAVSSASPLARAGHPCGTSDPEGFAAMGVLEVLVHTHDIAQGFGMAWEPSADLCGRVLARLFPDAPPGSPTAVLLWCAGRAPLGDTPRQASWRWDSSVRDMKLPAPSSARGVRAWTTHPTDGRRRHDRPSGVGRGFIRSKEATLVVVF